MGLGLLGRTLQDALFLLECGAELIITDLKMADDLKTSLEKLKGYENVRYTLGEHRLEDFKDRDFILKNPGVPLDSPFIAEARKNGIVIEMGASLFAKLAPAGVTLVGVTGTRGKTTTTVLIYEILKKAFGDSRVFLGGNIRDTATLPLLAKVKAGDYVVLELDSWQLQGFGEAKISPHVAVFTTFFDDHLNYYKGDRKAYFGDKAEIFRHQKATDFIVAGEGVAEMVTAEKPKGKLVIARASDVPASWEPKIIGEHNKLNIACARAAALALNISDDVIQKAVEGFGGVEGRLQLLRAVRDITIYNDNNSTTPEATIAALRALGALSKEKNIIVIMGGSDKGLDMRALTAEVPKYCKAVILLKETGSEMLVFPTSVSVTKKDTLKECVDEAMRLAKKGDVILFSPAFASFGKWFKNEYDRNDQFVALIQEL